MPVQGQTSPRGGNFRLARGDSMNKVIASASPAINAEGPRHLAPAGPRAIGGLPDRGGHNRPGGVGVNGHVEVPTGGREKSPLRCG